MPIWNEREECLDLDERQQQQGRHLGQYRLDDPGGHTDAQDDCEHRADGAQESAIHSDSISSSRNPDVSSQ